MDCLSADLAAVTLTAAALAGLAFTAYIYVSGKSSIERARRLTQMDSDRTLKRDERDSGE